MRSLVAITNMGLPCQEEEQDCLRLLHSHQRRQEAYLFEGYFDFSPGISRKIRSGYLDQRKQAATYVGLPKRGKRIAVNARLSVPWSLTEAETRQLMSLFAKELRDLYGYVCRDGGGYFGIEELNEIVLSHEFKPALDWPHRRTGLKSKKFRAANYATSASSA